MTPSGRTGAGAGPAGEELPRIMELTEFGGQD